MSDFTTQRDDFSYSTVSMRHVSGDPNGVLRTITVAYNGKTNRAALAIEGEDALTQRVVSFKTRKQVEETIEMLTEVLKEMQ